MTWSRVKSAVADELRLKVLIVVVIFVVFGSVIALVPSIINGMASRMISVAFWQKLTVEQFEQRLRRALKDVKRPNLFLAIIASIAAWFVTMLLRLVVQAIFWAS